jgi:hypothetical protein
MDTERINILPIAQLVERRIVVVINFLRSLVRIKVGRNHIILLYELLGLMV